MASLPVRDQVADHLLTPQDSALVVIDYEPSQFAAVHSDRGLLLENIVSTVKTAATGRRKPILCAPIVLTERLAPEPKGGTP